MVEKSAPHPETLARSERLSDSQVSGFIVRLGSEVQSYTYLSIIFNLKNSSRRKRDFQNRIFSRPDFDGGEESITWAGMMLGFSLDHPDFNLGRFFGRNQPNKKNNSGPTTWNIVKKIVINNFRQTHEIAKALKLPHNRVGRHLDRLSAEGFLAYQSVDGNRPVSTYALLADRPATTPSPAPIRESSDLTRDVYRVLSANPDVELSLSSLVEELGIINERWHDRKDNFSLSVSAVLAHLGRNGYCNINNKRSEILLSDDQRETLTRFIKMIEGFQSRQPDISNAADERAQSIRLSITDQDAILQKIERNSTMRKQIPIETLKSMISRRANGGITFRELMRILRSKGFIISRQTLNLYILDLEAEGFIKRTTDGDAKRIFRNNTNQ